LASIVRGVLDHGQIGDIWKLTADHGNWETVVVEPQDALVAG
jgi:hypothetical protein